MSELQAPLIFTDDANPETPVFVIGDTGEGVKIATSSQHGAGLSAAEVARMLVWLSAWFKAYAEDPQCRAVSKETHNRCRMSKHVAETEHDFAPPLDVLAPVVPIGGEPRKG